MKYLTKLITLIVILSLSIPAPGECLRPTAVSRTPARAIELDQAIAGGDFMKLLDSLKRADLETRVRSFQSFIAKVGRTFKARAALWDVLVEKSYMQKGLFAGLGDYERIEFISKCLSLGLRRRDSRQLYDFLKSIGGPQEHILPEARKLISSYINVYEVDKPTHIATVFSLYKSQKEIEPYSSENRYGQDYLRRKLRQLDDLYSINPNTSWQLIMVQDGDDSRFSADGKKTIDIARHIVETEFAQLLKSGGVVFLELTQETKERIGSVKGGAIVLGMHWAVSHGADYAISTDADLSAHLGLEGLLLGKAIKEGDDVVIGSIYRPDSIVPYRSLYRKALSIGYTLLIKAALPELWRLSDFQRSFKCYGRDALSVVLPTDERGDFERHFVYNFSFETNLLARAKKAGFSVGEEGIVWVDLPSTGATVSYKQMGRMVWGLLKQRWYLTFHSRGFMQKAEEYHRQHKGKRLIPAGSEKSASAGWSIDKAAASTLGAAFPISSSVTAYSREIIAIEILAIEGADMLIEQRRKDAAVIETAPKASGGDVTKLDIELQRFYIDELHKLFPGWRFIGEKKGIKSRLLDDGKAEFVCIIDPIDGTGEFSRRSDYSQQEFKPMFKHIEYGTGIALFKRLPDRRLKPIYSIAVLPEINLDGSGFSIAEAVDDIEGVYLNGRRQNPPDLSRVELENKDVIVEPRQKEVDIARAIAWNFRRAFLDVSTLVSSVVLATAGLYSDVVVAHMGAKPCVWDSAIGGFIALKAGRRTVYVSDGEDFFPIDPKRLNREWRSDSLLTTDDFTIRHILRALRQKGLIADSGLVSDTTKSASAGATVGIDTSPASVGFATYGLTNLLKTEAEASTIINAAA